MISIKIFSRLYFLNHKQPFIYSNKLHMCLRFNKRWKNTYFNTKGIQFEMWCEWIIKRGWNFFQMSYMDLSLGKINM